MKSAILNLGIIEIVFLDSLLGTHKTPSINFFERNNVFKSDNKLTKGRL